jgi:acylphosphatase
VRGRVQGVGFRWFVLRQARQLGLVGWVRNRLDGSVEAVASGAEESLRIFEGSLRRGPAGAVVELLDVAEVPHEVVESKSFEIKH